MESSMEERDPQEGLRGARQAVIDLAVSSTIDDSRKQGIKKATGEARPGRCWGDIDTVAPQSCEPCQHPGRLQQHR